MNVLGFSPTLAMRNLKVKLWRCVERMIDLQVIKPTSKSSAFSKAGPGEYSIVFQQGDYFKRRNKILPPVPTGETAIHDVLRSLGFDDRGICRLIREFSPALLRVWTDVSLAAKERNGGAFIKKSPQAFLVDNLKNAAKGMHPPDWYHEQRRAERRGRKTEPTVPWQCETRRCRTKLAPTSGLLGKCSDFLAVGQPESQQGKRRSLLDYAATRRCADELFG